MYTDKLLIAVPILSPSVPLGVVIESMGVCV